ncbi:MAG: hypothetical protein GX020_02555 [Firmicutes bacterium]|nr:hypothetical protein [Bacillota bacterium]
MKKQTKKYCKPTVVSQKIFKVGYEIIPLAGCRHNMDFIFHNAYCCS